METRLLSVLFCSLFIASNSSFAKNSFISSSSAAAKNQVSEKAKISNSSLYNNYLPYLQFGGTKFFNVDSAKAGVDANVFAPLWQKDASQLVFAHLRFFDRTGKPFEGNAHMGYRHLVPENVAIYWWSCFCYMSILYGINKMLAVPKPVEKPYFFPLQAA